MLGSVVLSPVGASSPLRPDRVLRTNWAGVLRGSGLYNAHIRGRALRCSPSSQARPFALPRAYGLLSFRYYASRGGNPSGEEVKDGPYGCNRGGGDRGGGAPTAVLLSS